jgi:Mg2+/Co2+ transporter CorB
MSESDIILTLISIGFLLILSGFFSGSETALTAITRSRIYKLEVEGNRRAKLVAKLRQKKESLLGAILLGNNLVNIAASALATSLAISLWGNAGVVYVTAIMTLLVLIFAEVLPKTVAIQHTERVALFVSPVITLVVRLFSPITTAVQWIIRMVLKVFGVDLNENQTLVSASEAIKGTIELHHKEGEMVKQDRDMLGTILDLGDIEVDQIMVHRKHVQSINIDLPIPNIIEQAIGFTHSRIPLWQGRPENIIAVMHVKNLLTLINKKQTITRKTLLRGAANPWFIPETTTLKDQLLAFRQKRQHFAIVIDEYGEFLGIVTLEDILEEIVGEIDDEHDVRYSKGIYPEGENAYIVEGSVTIRDLNRELDWSLPDEPAATVAGLLINEAREIPAKGTRFSFYNTCFTVLDKRANQITKLKLELLESEEEESDGL